MELVATTVDLAAPASRIPAWRVPASRIPAWRASPILGSDTLETVIATLGTEITTLHSAITGSSVIGSSLSTILSTMTMHVSSASGPVEAGAG